MNAFRLLLVAGLLLSAMETEAQSQVRSIELHNNQPFDIRLPVKLRGAELAEGQQHIDGLPAQQSGEDVIFIADVPASSAGKRKAVEPRQVANLVEPAEQGIAIRHNQPLGTLQWGLVLRHEKIKRPEFLSTKADFDQQFKPLPLSFQRQSQGPLFDVWSAEAEQDGLHLRVELHAFHNGYLDIHATVTNRSAPREDVYCALVTRWEQPQASRRSVCYDNSISEMSERWSTSFREGTERHLYVQRGVDWMNFGFEKAAVGWLNDFSPTFTVHKQATPNRGPRWVGANVPQLGQEAQTAGNVLYSITEIARPNIRSYRNRLDDNVLPGEDQPLTTTSRLVLSDEKLEDARVDQLFIAYTGYNPQTVEQDRATLSFGVPHVVFGTNYFPYSTLGENFIYRMMPGMSGETYWPLAADTVTNWQAFADDIRRDLRIAKAMGYEVIRLHHVELLGKLDKQLQYEYLDFYFGEIEKLGQKVLLDIKLPPAEVADMIKRYRHLTHGVEIDNEVLIFQIYDDDVRYWKDVYEAVKEVAPEVPVHLTGHTNASAFVRLEKLGVPFDKVGAHAYADAVEAIPSMRGFALAIANHASEIGKPPVITEWNWRFLTRIPFEERAPLARDVYEQVLRTRSITEMYQFQFQDSLAMNPSLRKGIRRYEHLFVSRRPKPEALEMMKLIESYSAATAPVRMVRVSRPQAVLEGGRGSVEFSVTNTSGRTLELKLSAEAPGPMKATLKSDAKLTLEPGASAQVPLAIEVSGEKKPGFYHIFLRLEGDDLVRYGWAMTMLQGEPTFGASQIEQVVYGENALKFNFNRPLTVVYGKDATPPQLEAAWVLFSTLEAATGRPLEIYHLPSLPMRLVVKEPLILVGRPDQHDLIAHVSEQVAKHVGDARSFVVYIPAEGERGDRLVVGGKTDNDVAAAAMDLVLRFWPNAKDSGASRVKLVERSLAPGRHDTDLDK